MERRSLNQPMNPAIFVIRRLLLCLLALLIPFAAAQALNKHEWPKTDFSVTSIDLDEIMSGGPPKDGIPSIDEPKFETIETAADWLGETEPVIVLAHDSEARAYPGDLPVSVTFCPLCNASIVFDRRLDGVVYDFGTTGRLRKSDMVMYDRQTESWWQQFTGEGIVGEMTGAKLKQIPSAIVSFASFARYHPAGQVLSKETGFRRRYGQNPYRGYDDINSAPFLYRGEIDSRLPPMERVLSVRAAEQTLLFTLSALQDTPVLNTVFNKMPLTVFAFETMNSALDDASIRDSKMIPAAAVYSPIVDGKPLEFDFREGAAVDQQTGSRWNIMGTAIEGPMKGKSLVQIDGGVHFAFAWLAFDPEAEIHTAK